MKQHIKGVIIAIFSAIGFLFIVSFFVSSQLNVETDAVINAPKLTVVDYVKDPNHIQNWLGNLEGVQMQQKSPFELQYIGVDKAFHSLFFKAAKDGVEIEYAKEGEKKAVFTIFVKEAGAQSVVIYRQAWDLGGNPLVRLISLTREESLQKEMDQDLVRLKAATQ